MFGSKKNQEVEVKSEKQLCEELATVVKTFVTEYLDNGHQVEHGNIYTNDIIQKSIVRGVVELIGAEMIQREAKRQHAGQPDFVPPKWNPFKNVETRDNLTPQERASRLRKKQIDDNTAEFVAG